MTTLILQTYPAARSEHGGGLQVHFRLDGTPDPFPKREVEIKSTADALAALEAYKAEAQAVGVPLVATMRIKPGDRSPNGFKAANAKHYWPVNV